ncbi:hypothetical protein X975_23619, partial [Stegodyphus mimosarum]
MDFLRSCNSVRFLLFLLISLSKYHFRDFFKTDTRI